MNTWMYSFAGVCFVHIEIVISVFLPIDNTKQSNLGPFTKTVDSIRHTIVENHIRPPPVVF